MSTTTLTIHRDIAARLGKRCAEKRRDYYTKYADGCARQMRESQLVSDVYADRAATAEREDDCDD